MKRISFVFAMTLAPVVAFGADTDGAAPKKPQETELFLTIRRIGLEWSKTKVTHAAEYTDSPIQALKATSQDFIKAIADMVLGYKKDKFKWDNSLFMEYGKTTLKPYNEPATTSENADKILLSSDMSWACWKWGQFSFGPTVRGAYETEFAASGDAPRQNLVRANAGMSLFDHPIIKSLYLTGVYEYDFTYSDDKISKTAAELGWRLEYKLREGVKFHSNGYYREYLSYSSYIATDLERDFNATVRMDTNLWNKFTLGPYVQYRRAKARGADQYGSNFIIGISFNYINRFGIIDVTNDDKK